MTADLPSPPSQSEIERLAELYETMVRDWRFMGGPTSLPPRFFAAEWFARNGVRAASSPAPRDGERELLALLLIETGRVPDPRAAAHPEGEPTP